MAGELPGANIFALALQAPADALSLATKQVTETMGVFSLGMQTLGAELATPPSMAGLALPELPGFPGMAPAAAAAPPSPMQQAFRPKTKLLGM